MRTEQERRPIGALAGGTVIGALGGLIGLGGAELRLPLLSSVFRFPPIEGIILNKAASLIVVASALVFRTKNVPFGEVIAHAPVVANLLVGSLLGAWLGASLATRMQSVTLHRVIAILLVAIAAVLLFRPWRQRKHPDGPIEQRTTIALNQFSTTKHSQSRGHE